MNSIQSQKSNLDFQIKEIDTQELNGMGSYGLGFACGVGGAVVIAGGLVVLT